ncbi:hypothetical protein CEXT_72591, partial [Caerostris extrusa]
PESSALANDSKVPMSDGGKGWNRKL